MSAQLRREGASPPPATRPPPLQPDRDRGEEAFDRWLRQELARLYDTALSEPVPEELARLLRDRR
jgi:hypothetical protein